MDYIEVKTQGLWVTKGYVKYDGNRIIKKVCINLRFPRDMLMEIYFCGIIDKPAARYSGRNLFYSNFARS